MPTLSWIATLEAGIPKIETDVTRFSRSILCRLAGAALLALVAGPAIAQSGRGLADPTGDGWTWRVEGPAQVIDGDSIRLKGVRIRLDGIDAPELQQTCTSSKGVPWGCGIAAKVWLEEAVAGETVICFGDDEGLDRYGRQLAVCHLKNDDPAGAWSKMNLNAALVWEGWALAYRRYSTKYLGNENAARSSKSGMWSGTFETPWEWRARQRREKPPE